MIGITLIRNGNLLNYPWKICIEQMLTCCRKVLVNCDPGEDNTLDDLKELSKKHANRIEIYQHKWDMSSTGDGRELAIQANNLLAHVYKDEWILYCQADEIVHEKDAQLIQSIVNDLTGSPYTEVEFLRTYFYQNLTKRLPKHEIFLGRIFLCGTSEVGGDGMFLRRHTGLAYRPESLFLYHYSRIGTEKQVDLRVKTLDKLFHLEKEVETFPIFRYDETLLKDYFGVHPKGVKEFYE